MDKKHYDVNKFWVNFRESVIEYGVSDKHADWYVIYGISAVVNHRR